MKHIASCSFGKDSNATVRIHAGKMTKEERQQAFEQASRKMRREMERGRNRREVLKSV